jgi:hypothetical protein
MFKQSVKTISILAALMSMHSMASATCKGAECDVETQVEVKFDSSYYLSPNAKGIYLQSNNGDRTAIVDMKNVVIKNNGEVSAIATAVGNTASFEVNTTSNVALRHINQVSTGDQLAVVNYQQSSKSVTGAVELSATAVGNNASILNEGTSLSDLSINQCNVGDGVAIVNFKYDPTKLTASATAVGNSIAVRTTR